LVKKEPKLEGGYIGGNQFQEGFLIPNFQKNQAFKVILKRLTPILKIVGSGWI